MSKSVLPLMASIDSASDDDVPEETSVSVSRLQTMTQQRGIRETERKGREEERERRRRRNEMFKAQKERKLHDLSKRKLPQDVLDAVSTASTKKPEPAVPHDVPLDEEDSEDDDKEAERLSDSGVEDINDDDYIPLSSKSSKLSLVTLRDVAQKKLSVVEQALQFREKRLYNQKSIPRENAKQRRARKEKRKAIR